MKRLTALFLALTLILTAFCGCSQENSEQKPSDTGENTKLTYVSHWDNLFDAVGGMLYLESCTYRGGRLWFKGGLTDSDETAAGSIAVDGSDYQPIELPEISEEKKVFPEGSMSYMAVFPDEDGYVLLENHWSGEYGNDGRAYFLTWFSDGKETRRVELKELEDLGEYGGLITMGQSRWSDGRFCIETSMGSFIYKADGSLDFSLEDRGFDRIREASDGTLYTMAWRVGNPLIRKIDTEKGKTGDALPVKWEKSSGTMSLIENGAPDFYFGDRVYTWDAEKSEAVYLFSLSDVDIDSNGSSNSIEYAVRTGDDTWMFVVDGNGGSVSTVFVSPGVREEKTTLDLSVFGNPGVLNSYAVEFNKMNDKYRVELTDWYSDSEPEDAQLRFRTAVAAGDIPDMVEVSGIPFDSWAKWGLFCDLYSLMDADSTLSRDDMVESLLQASEIDGKLYSLPASFCVVTAGGLADVVGKLTNGGVNPTFAEVRRVMDENPQMTQVFIRTSQIEIFQSLLMMNMSFFADRDSGKCNFNSPEFIDLLEICKKAPQTLDDSYWSKSEYELLKSGKAMYTGFNLESVEEYQRFGASLQNEGLITGIPSPNGRNGTVGMTELNLGITESCKNKEGAWEFLKYVFERENGERSLYGFGMPMKKSTYEAKLAEGMEKYYDVNGNEVPHVSVADQYGSEILVYAATEEDITEIRGLVDSVERIMYLDDSLLNLVTEEASAYFAGMKSAADTAAVIQSRAEIYVAEGM